MRNTPALIVVASLLLRARARHTRCANHTAWSSLVWFTLAGMTQRAGKPVLSVTLADCDLQTFAAGGKGGQHQNTTNTGVRVIHRASGARGEARDNRSQLQNKRAAFRRMVESPKFRIWLNRELFHRGETLEQRVERDMNPRNLLVEVRGSLGWQPERSASEPF